MGIKDLLRALEPLAKVQNISEFQNKSIAIDASGWLHKGLYAATEDFVDSGFVDNQLYVDYILMRIHELKSYGIEPVMVFDGRRSYLKSETNSKREESRRINMQNGQRLLDSMRCTKDSACSFKLKHEAMTCFQRGLSVTHEMEKNTIAALRKINVPVIISPYEADCQLVHLCDINVCQGIMTEDSDVLVYAAVCGKSFPILYKFEKASQSVQCLDLGKIFDISDCSQDTLSNIQTSSLDDNCKIEKNFVKNLTFFQGFNGRRMFVQMCVLAGCDYSDSIHGIGLQTAQQAVIRFRKIPCNMRLQRICHHFKANGKTVADTYLHRIQRAEALFHYQLVYNPLARQLQYISPPVFANVNDENKCGHGPVIEEDDLEKLGTAADILRDAPEDISFERVCLGYCSIKDFQVIPCQYPWDKASLRQPMIVSNSTSSMWNYRRMLIQSSEKNPHPQHRQQQHQQHQQYIKSSSVDQSLRKPLVSSNSIGNQEVSSKYFNRNLSRNPYQMQNISSVSQIKPPSPTTRIPLSAISKHDTIVKDNIVTLLDDSPQKSSNLIYNEAISNSFNLLSTPAPQVPQTVFISEESVMNQSENIRMVTPDIVIDSQLKQMNDETINSGTFEYLDSTPANEVGRVDESIKIEHHVVSHEKSLVEIETVNPLTIIDNPMAAHDAMYAKVSPPKGIPHGSLKRKLETVSIPCGNNKSNKKGKGGTIKNTSITSFFSVQKQTLNIAV